MDNKCKRNKLDEIELLDSDVVTTCPKCSFIGKSTKMKDHMEKSHEKQVVCEECGNCFLSDHFQAKHGKQSSIEPFPCAECGLVKATVELFQDHMKNHHKAS